MTSASSSSLPWSATCESRTGVKRSRTSTDSGGAGRGRAAQADSSGSK
uniref:Uncharacterized protein n=1 Tax=Arundo donax TaxID=35708 RepID=A0A0A8YA66_ARUDO